MSLRLNDANKLTQMNWKTCSVEVEARIGKRPVMPLHANRSTSRQWDAKERVDDVSNDLL